MAQKARKIATKWIVQNRALFRDFLDQTAFPDPERAGERGSKFQYPEWLIMFIAILSVKLKVKSYVQIHRMAVDSKADDYDLYREFSRQRKIKLVTYCRKHMNKSENRRRMIADMGQPPHQKIYKERGYRVEPMQGSVKDIFDLNRCWMRGNDNNRWLFAAMGLTVQMHQLIAYEKKKTTWKIKQQVLG